MWYLFINKNSFAFCVKILYTWNKLIQANDYYKACVAALYAVVCVCMCCAGNKRERECVSWLKETNLYAHL